MPSRAELTRFQPELPLRFRENTIAESVIINEEARRMPTHVMGGTGSGKSLLTGSLVLAEFLRGRPQFVIDPTGGAIDAFLNVVANMPKQWQDLLLPRLRYTDLAATDYVDPWPLFENPYNESLMALINKEVHHILQTDTALQEAPVMGENALKPLYSHAGRVGLALGGGLPEIIDIVKHPKKWQPRFAEALRTHPEIYDAVDEMNSYARIKRDADRARLSTTFLAKTFDMLATPQLNARHCTMCPGLTMSEVAQNHITWLIDGRNLSPLIKPSQLLRALRKVTEFATFRGFTGRNHRFGLVVDEITEMLNFSSKQNDVMAATLEQLVSVIARNYGIDTLLVHQSLAQIGSDRVRSALMNMPNQIIGMIHDPEDREILTEHFMTYEPYRVKKTIPQYVNKPVPRYLQTISNTEGGFLPTYTVSQSVFSEANYVYHHSLTEEFGIDEQRRMFSEKFAPGSLKSLEFIYRVASAEGKFNIGLRKMALYPLTLGYPDPILLANFRQQLKERDGYPVTQLIAENTKRLTDAIRIAHTKKDDSKNATIATSKPPNANKDTADIRTPDTTKSTANGADNTSWDAQFYETEEEGKDARR